MANQNEKDRGRGQDRDRVAAGQEWEVNYMTQKFNVTAEQVREAVEKVGNSRNKIEEFLASRNK